MSEDSRGGNGKDANINSRCSKPFKARVKKEIRKINNHLNTNLTISTLVNSLLKDWMIKKGVPKKVIEEAESEELETERRKLLKDWNNWWYFEGHMRKNIKNVDEVYDGCSEKGQKLADDLMRRYKEMDEKYIKIYTARAKRIGVDLSKVPRLEYSEEELEKFSKKRLRAIYKRLKGDDAPILKRKNKLINDIIFLQGEE